MKTDEAIKRLAFAVRWLGYVLGGVVLLLGLFARDWGIALILGSIAPVLVGAGWALSLLIERLLVRNVASGSKGS